MIELGKAIAMFKANVSQSPMNLCNCTGVWRDKNLYGREGGEGAKIGEKSLCTQTRNTCKEVQQLNAVLLQSHSDH